MRDPLDVLRLWFTFETRVDRRTYLVHGFALMVVKYLFDAMFIWLALGRHWTPLDYLRVGVSTAERLPGASRLLLIALAAWSVPFLWIAVSMSMRRAIDADWSPWLCLLVLIPYVNYAGMLLLAALPTSARSGAPAEPPRAYEDRLPSALMSIAFGAGLGLAALAALIFFARNYEGTMFLGTPFIVGALTGYVFNRRYPASNFETTQVVLLTFAFIAGVLVLTAVEGALCLLMAAPLTVIIGMLGGQLGRWIALRGAGSTGQAMLAILMIPLSAVTEMGQRPVALREVMSVVEIDAPPDVVWRHVIEFAELEPPREMIFRLGIAYPMRARIEGTGVGAVRHCEFSTGAFVEPITRWEPGRLLAFDVTRQPPPLEEWSPYANIAPPHLDGYFQSRRGEFRLIALPDGRTRLEGSTWYEMRVYPESYWTLFGDAFIRRIHGRVLRHIRTLAEQPT